MSNKLTIVQIESFYASFLQQFYANNPHLESASFAQQIQWLLASGYSEGHNVTPLLNPARWDVHYLVPNAAPAQAEWAREHGCEALAANWAALLVAQLQHLAPDVLYLSDIPHFEFRILDQLPKRPLVVGWHATTVNPRIAWHRIDLLLSGIRSIRQRTQELGVRATAHFMPAAPHYMSHGNSGADRMDVVFSGSFSGNIHAERASQYRSLSRRIGPYQLSILTPHPFAIEAGENIRFLSPVFGREVMSAYGRSRIVLDSRGDFHLGDPMYARDTSNMRIFEATRAGALLITEAGSNLEDLFDIGKEIVTYTSTDDLIAKVNYYLDPVHEDERAAIAQAGFVRTARDHSLSNRSLLLDAILTDAYQRQQARRRASPQLSAAGQHLVTLVVRADNALFVLQTARTVHSALPGVTLLVLVDGNALTKSLQVALAGADVLELGDAQALWPEAARLCDDALEPNAYAVLALSLALRRHPLARRITYLDASVAVLNVHALHFVDEGLAYHLDLGWTDTFAFERQELGDKSLALLSLPTSHTHLPHWLGLHNTVLAPGWSSLENRSRAQALELVLQDPHWRSIPCRSPWASCQALDKDESRAGLFVLPLVRRLTNGVFELASFPELSDWSACYSKVYVPTLAAAMQLLPLLPSALGVQSTTPGGAPISRLLFDRIRLRADGLRRLTHQQYQLDRSHKTGWNTASVAHAQHAAFMQLLSNFRAGQRRGDLVALQALLETFIPAGAFSLLETGCGSGYNSVFLCDVLGLPCTYCGIDFASSMVEYGRQVFPDLDLRVMSSEQLDFVDGAFTVVLNGASLMHTVHFEQAVAESARVGADVCIFHTVTVCAAANNQYFEKYAYGSPVVEVCFSEQKLLELLRHSGLEPVALEPSIDYNLQAVLGCPTRSVSVACRHSPAPDTTTHHYCTYFDSNYLPRGLLMIRSLHEQDPRAHIFVLCLDDLVAELFSDFASYITPISIAELTAADPDFATVRSNRTLVEWYFTATSALANYLLVRFPGVQRLTYLDGDLYFYASPLELLAEAHGASVQIIEHRFSPHLAPLEVYGRFNVGWISFFNTEEGRQVVADYRRECIEWCYDRLDGDRFADQKYLDRWPARYPRCCISRVKGGNVAPWNLARWRFDSLGGVPFVDAERIVFYHFHGVQRAADGSYGLRAVEGFEAYMELLYQPYLARLAAIEQELAPLLARAVRREIRYPDPNV